MAYCLVCCNGDREQAKDLTQDTFARAFRSLDSLTDPAKFAGWLITIAGNVCRTHGAREVRRREVLEEMALEQDTLGQDPPPDDKEAREVRIAVVRRVLEGVDDKPLREIVSLRYTDPEHSTQQIAERMGMPHGTVTSKLLRFRAAVRKDLALSLLVVEEQAPTSVMQEAM